MNKLFKAEVYSLTRQISHAARRTGQRGESARGAEVAFRTGTVPQDAGSVQGGRVCRTTLAEISSLALAYNNVSNEALINTYMSERLLI